MTDVKNIIIFKKREFKGKKFREDAFKRSEDCLSDEEVSSKLISEIKAEQIFRKRRLVMENMEGMSNKAGYLSAVIGNGGPGNEDIGYTMGSQFATQGTGSSSGPVTHEKIMEEYVSNKIQLLTGESKVKEIKPLTDEDRLYIVPDDIRALDGKGGQERNADKEENSGSMLAWNTGIAEVALPIEFKMRNIEETEKAKKALEEAKKVRTVRSNAENVLAGCRFMRPELKSRVPVASATPSTYQGDASGQNTSKAGVPRPPREKSNDDFVMDKFKKRQRRFN